MRREARFFKALAGIAKDYGYNNLHREFMKQARKKLDARNKN